MSFLNPFLLYGLGAVSVPIIIHLLMQRRVKHVIWAATRFLLHAVEKNKRQMNLEDMILLLLRCLLLAFLALALARPTLRSSKFNLFGKGGETVVIAIDNSYSMSQTDGVSSRFEKAQKAAEQALDGLPNGSSAALFLVSEVVNPVIPQPTRDMNLVRKMIREAKISDRGTDMAPAFQQAIETLKQHPGGAQAICLFTDGQAVGWKKIGEIRGMLAPVQAQIRTRLVIVGEKEENNLGISDLRLASAMSPANQALRFDATVTNFGLKEARNVQVSLSVDADKPSDEGTIEHLPPGATKSIPLYARCDGVGFHSVTARIPADRLPADDSRSLVVQAFNDISVLLVDGAPGAEPRDSEAYYLANALTPVTPVALKDFYIKTKTIHAGELEGLKLGDYEAVILANVADFSDATVAAMQKYAQRGGGLIFFPGDKINTDFYNKKLFKSGLLPATFGEARGKVDQEDEYFKLQDLPYRHSIVSLWKDPANGTLATAHFYRAFPLNPGKSDVKEAGEPVVVLDYSDGTPAVVEHTFGFGRVIQFSSTADMAWNDQPLRPSFVPLIQRTLGAITGRQGERLNFPAGGVFNYLCDPELVGKDARFIRPDSNKTEGEYRRIGLVNGMPMIQYNNTDIAGVYTVYAGSENPMTIKFATQENTEESKLAEVAASEFDSLGSNVRLFRWTPGMSMKDQLVLERAGLELWGVFAILALAIAVTETLLAHKFSKAK